MQCNPTRSIRNIYQLGLLGHPTRRELVCVMRHMHFLLQEKHQLDSMWKNGMCGSSCDALNGIVMISCILESVAECTHSKSYVNGQIIVKRTLKWSGQKSVNLRSNLSNRNVIFLFYHRKVRNRILSISVPHDFNRPVVSLDKSINSWMSHRPTTHGNNRKFIGLRYALCTQTHPYRDRSLPKAKQ